MRVRGVLHARTIQARAPAVRAVAPSQASISQAPYMLHVRLLTKNEVSWALRRRLLLISSSGPSITWLEVSLLCSEAATLTLLCSRRLLTAVSRCSSEFKFQHVAQGYPSPLGSLVHLLLASSQHFSGTMAEQPKFNSMPEGHFPPKSSKIWEGPNIMVPYTHNQAI